MSLGSNSDNSDLILEDSTKIPSSEEYIALGITIDNILFTVFETTLQESGQQT